MQHLDEGTIHAWLDGALTPDEVARVEAHVAECSQCAASVAEARGFIAASSRILTALDHVPRGVVPVARPARWKNPAMWRAAAAVLVVAVGSLVVVRNTGNKSAVTEFSTVRKADNTSVLQQVSPAPIAENSPQATATSGSQRNTGPTAKTTGERGATGVIAATEKKLAAISPPAADMGRARAPSLEPSIVASDNIAGAAPTAPATTNIAQKVSPASGYANVQPAAPPQIVLRGNMTAMSVRDSVSGLGPLKVVGTPRQTGAKVTLYEVTPTDTVTLTEFVNVQLESVVTGMSTTRQRLEGQAAGKAAAAPAAAPAPQRADAAVANGVTTVTWTDAASGNVLKLSGRLPLAQLQQIKIRIERERAAAAAAGKKNP